MTIDQIFFTHTYVILTFEIGKKRQVSFVFFFSAIPLEKQIMHCTEEGWRKQQPDNVLWVAMRWRNKKRRRRRKKKKRRRGRRMPSYFFA